jgi:GNAT superfamily N-acetyltransferase
MDDVTLARLEHENLITAMGTAARQAPGAIVRQADGVAAILTGHPLRLFNQVLVADDVVGPGAIEGAVELARTRGDLFVVNLRAGFDDGHLPVVEALGLAPASAEPWMPGMALDGLPAIGGTPVPAGHEIRRVTDAAGIADHCRSAAGGFEMPIEWLESVMTEAMLEIPEAAVYVGYTDGEPVSSGLGVRTGRTIGVYNIATIPSARGRGYGAAMTMRVVDDGAAAGCDVAILQASDMGRPIYERLGFRTVVEYMAWVDPASATPDAAGNGQRS